MKKIDSLDQISDENYFIFKHSLTCGISSAAYNEVLQVENEIELPIYMLVVQTQLKLSNQVERHFGIIHESPQLILVKGGTAAWNRSHWSIRKSAILEAANGNAL